MILLLCCTYNRHTCLERLLRFYLDQDYSGNSLLYIYNNSPIVQHLNVSHDEIPSNKKIILDNNYLNLSTGGVYTDVGSIHRDALERASRLFSYEVVTFFEDDNFYLPNHISEGMRGMQRAYELNCCAYKPLRSYFKSGAALFMHTDVMEPSIFVDYEFLKVHGFKKTSVDFHHAWINALHNEKKYFIDADGISTLIYISHVNDGMSNLSGTGNNSSTGMLRHRNRAKDIGDRLITPISKIEAAQYYSIIDAYHLQKNVS